MHAIRYPDTGSDFWAVGDLDYPEYYDNAPAAVDAVHRLGGAMTEVDFVACSECPAIVDVVHVTLIDPRHPLCPDCNQELVRDMAEQAEAEERDRQADLEARGEEYMLGIG